MTHHQKILTLLDDEQWHCGTEIMNLYIKDDRKRISELVAQGYNIVGKPCDCGKHVSGLYKRKLIKKDTLF
jgi:hypothetical protein